ncbi:MAG TPA: heparan-alpha-glucosaminide N-acetyltransferase domain-containing protein, partial [Chitinophagaceae bacterium]|nr:heparan-alpha-glucosaminide N-acetyltransferase domain-containing protein [Chitinophagaceae bacterium]
MQTSPSKTGTATTARVQSVDVLRGAVMVLMAVDHIRCYSGLPAGGPSAGIFFTRWITHFCAPAFVFFAGTSAYLYFNKIQDKSKLPIFLLTRGLLLVVLELTIIKFFWGFNLNYSEFTLAGVIWMIGWCMVLLAAFVRLKPLTIAITGLIIIAAQQVFYYVPLIFPAAWRSSVGYIWGFFYPSGFKGMPGIAVLFVILPWLGVMMAGFGFGKLLLHN